MGKKIELWAVRSPQHQRHIFKTEALARAKAAEMLAATWLYRPDTFTNDLVILEKLTSVEVERLRRPPISSPREETNG